MGNSTGILYSSQAFRCRHRAFAFKMRTSVVGRSRASVCTFPSLLTTPMPEQTRPKIVCLPSSHGVGASVMKNCTYQCQVIQGGNLHKVQKLLSKTCGEDSHPCTFDSCNKSHSYKPQTQQLIVTRSVAQKRLCVTWLPFVLAPALAMLRIPAPV